MEIRPFEERDYEQVLALWQASELTLKASDTLPELLKVVERGPELFLVAEEKGGRCIVGAVIGGWDGRRGYIYHLAVLPTRRGQGVGTQLMVEVESRLRARGAIKVNLHVEPRNRGVVEFYGRRGYVVGDLVFMGKELDR